ncbi:APC family permease [Rhodococcus sp. 1168]|uniref:APC family permease n=1 Tax=Rhodococcus sp. 1168 TaxID=2018041 RepID=UPI000B5AE0EF|nr:APC family permease [Rhodococcus sp. 1168]
MSDSSPYEKGALSSVSGDLTVAKIVFLVIAAASPLAAVVATLPLAFSLGAGSATPAMYLIAGIILLCFAVGYAAMSRKVVGAGGLYAYIAAGLGPVPAIAAGFVALLAYNALAVMLVATFSYFSQMVFVSLGITLPWPAYAAFAIACTAILGYRRIDLSARIIGVLIVAELAILGIVDLVLIRSFGVDAFPASAFDLTGLGQSALGLGLMFAFTSFLGFEAAALYGEESCNPKRTVPLATYVSVAVVSIFYGVTSWVTVGAIGPDNVRSEATEKLGDLILDLAAVHLGQHVADIMTLLLLTSLFATLLACHNSTNRLTYALGRDGVLPRALGRVHPKYMSPARASVTQSAINCVVISAFAAAGLDPYLNLSVSMSGLGTLGLVLLQATTAFAVIGFFRKRADRHWWRTTTAPLLGGLGLSVAAVLIVVHYRSLTGVDNMVVNALPTMLAIVALIGALYALWLQRYRPAVYAEIGNITDPSSLESHPTHTGGKTR